jgi:hypothetical protein
MSGANSLNTGKGREFQRVAADFLGKHFSVEFRLDEAMPIGNPPKLHRFDLVSVDSRYIGECKNYSWTETGNMPSAKMAFMNEALLYLSLAPAETYRFIVMRLDRHLRRTESLSAYYYRTYLHLLNGVYIIELDEKTGTIVELGMDPSRRPSKTD